MAADLKEVEWVADQLDRMKLTACAAHIRDAISEIAASRNQANDATEPCDCKIGDCKRITRRCQEDRL